MNMETLPEELNIEIINKLYPFINSLILCSKKWLMCCMKSIILLRCKKFSLFKLFKNLISRLSIDGYSLLYKIPPIILMLNENMLLDCKQLLRIIELWDKKGWFRYKDGILRYEGIDRNLTMEIYSLKVGQNVVCYKSLIKPLDRVKFLYGIISDCLPSDELKKLNNLRKLIIMSLSKLQRGLDLISINTNLECLWLMDCSLKNVEEFLSKLSVSTLSIRKCSYIKSVYGLKMLKTLVIEECPTLNKIYNLLTLTNLKIVKQTLMLFNCPNVEQIYARQTSINSIGEMTKVMFMSTDKLVSYKVFPNLEIVELNYLNVEQHPEVFNISVSKAVTVKNWKGLIINLKGDVKSLTLTECNNLLYIPYVLTLEKISLIVKEQDVEMYMLKVEKLVRLLTFLKVEYLVSTSKDIDYTNVCVKPKSLLDGRILIKISIRVL